VTACWQWLDGFVVEVGISFVFAVLLDTGLAICVYLMENWVGFDWEATFVEERPRFRWVTFAVVSVIRMTYATLVIR